MRNFNTAQSLVDTRSVPFDAVYIKNNVLKTGLKMIFGFFKREKNSTQTINANADHKKDDKDIHNLFLEELTDLLKASKVFKPEYIKKYVGLYKKYEPFKGKKYGLIQKQVDFEESLLDVSKKKEVKELLDNVFFIAQRRAYNQVDLIRKKTLASKVIIKFPKDSGCCSDLLKYKKKFENKAILINKAPIFPLKSCINCGCNDQRLMNFTYQIDIGF